MTSKTLNSEYIILREPIKPLGTMRVDIFWHKSGVWLKRNWLRNSGIYGYCQREPMFTDEQIDKLVNIEWIYYEDV